MAQCLWPGKVTHTNQETIFDNLDMERPAQHAVSYLKPALGSQAASDPLITCLQASP